MDLHVIRAFLAGGVVLLLKVVELSLEIIVGGSKDLRFHL